MQRVGMIRAVLLALLVPAAFVAPDPGPVGDPPTRIRRTPTEIQWEVTPASVVVYLDGKRLGQAGDLKRTRTKPGRHTIRLVNGEDETELEIHLEKGRTLRFVLEFSG